MIATLNSDCSIVTLTSEALVASGVKTFTNLVLNTKLNCSATVTTVDLSSLIGSITDSKIEVPATTFYNDLTKTVFCDGVYYFELEITYDISSPAATYLVKDSACTFIDCSTKCKVLDYYIKQQDKKVYYLYYALNQGGSCDSCSCTEMCSLYTELTTLINDNSISNSDSGCGCS